MPGQVPYTVKFPDGYVQTFTGPDDMSDTDAFARATQERAIASGKIPTTGMAGWFQQMGQEKDANTALLTAGGMLAGGPLGAAAVTLAPLASDWLDYATKAHAGKDAVAPSAIRQGADVLQGAATAYGPKLLMGGLGKFAESTVPHYSQLRGGWVPGMKGSGTIPWAIRTAGEAANALEQGPVGQAIENAASRTTGAAALTTSALIDELNARIFGKKK